MVLAIFALATFLSQVEARIGQTVLLTGPESGYRLQAKPPSGNFRFDLRVRCDRPGVVLDTAGINAAPTGSFRLEIHADRKVSFYVWQPGWTEVKSKSAIGTGEARIIVERRGEKVSLKLDEGVSEATISAPLCQEPVWIGDFPGDDSWGPNYRIHPAITGEVTVLGLSPLPIAMKDWVIDEVGIVSTELRQRMSSALEAISRDAGGRFHAVFCKAANNEESIAQGRRVLEQLQAAFPGVPCGLLVYGGMSARAYNRSIDMDKKVGIDRVIAAWKSAQGNDLAELAASQLDLLAGRTSQKPVAVGEATIGTEGGKIQSQSGDFELSIPPQALKSNQMVRVSQLSMGPYGRVLHVEGCEELLAKPATLTYWIPEGVDPTTIGAVGHVSGTMWSLHPSVFDPGKRTLTAKVNHFSDQGWFGFDKSAHKALGAAVSAIGGTALILVAETALVGATAPVSGPVVAIVAVFGAVGWFGGGAEYDYLMKRDFQGPIPAEGFDLYWKPQEISGSEEVVALINTKTHKLITWFDARTTWQRSGATNTFRIELPGGEEVNLTDIRAVQVPKSVLVLGDDLATTKRWYDAHGFATPAKVSVLVAKVLGRKDDDSSKYGEYDGTYLNLNSDYLAEPSTVHAIIAHEYFHVIAKKQGLKEQFLGAEEAVAVALEALVWPGATVGMSENDWSRAGPILKNGFRAAGENEGFSAPERRGYLLWSLPKFIYYRHGVEDLRSLAKGTMSDSLLDQLFREYVRGLTNRDDGLEREEPSEDGKGKTSTGWPVQLSQMAESLKANALKAGKIDVPSCPALSIRSLLVRIPARLSGEPAPLVARRRTPVVGEELFLLKPLGSGGLGAVVSSSDRSKEEVVIGSGAAATPAGWDTGDLTLPIVMSAMKGSEAAGNPLYVYRLAPPVTFESVAASDGQHLKWSLPPLNGIPTGDALWGYQIYGRSPSGVVQLVHELRIQPEQSPGGLSNKGRSASADKIDAQASEFVLPTRLSEGFEALGIASVELVVMDGAKPLTSAITWAGASDDLLKELQKTRQFSMTFAGVTEQGYGRDFQVATWGTVGLMARNTMDSLISIAKDHGRTVAPTAIEWNGPAFRMEIVTGALEKTSTSYEGTTVNQANLTLSIAGHYDAKRRGVADVVVTYEYRRNSTFTPDPNWKPRNSGDALVGPPKPAKSSARDALRMVADFVPFTQKAPDGAGNTLYAFRLNALKPATGCTAESVLEQESLGAFPVPPQKIKLIAGPSAPGKPQTQPPGVSIWFLLPKS